MDTMFAYQKNRRYFAQIADGLEALAAAEIETLGGAAVKTVYRGVYFEADPATLYRVNYRSRLCSRVLAPLLRFDCHSSKYLHKTAYKLPWQELMGVETTFAVAASVAHSKIRHSQYAALCLKDALVDSFRDRTGQRPSVDTDNPDILIHLHIENNKASIGLDTSGGSLHRRGYRQETIAAPMQETVAAAIIRMSQWDGERPLLDPMCGSGTLLCEALMHYCRIPAGYLRTRFGFMNLPDFDPRIWDTVKKEADERIRPLPAGLISGSDRDGQAVAATRANLAVLPHGKTVVIRKTPFEKLGRVENAALITNPPYGLRLGAKDDMARFLKSLGDFFKQRCAGSIAFVYLGKKELAKGIGLKAAWKKPLKTGGLDGLLLRYDMY